MEFFEQLINQCMLWKPFTHQLDVVIGDGHKKLLIRFIHVEPFEVNWTEAICSAEDGKLTMRYNDYQVTIPFDKDFDYTQASSKLDGHDLVITIPGKTRVMSIPIRRDMTEANNGSN